MSEWNKTKVQKIADKLQENAIFESFFIPANIFQFIGLRQNSFFRDRVYRWLSRTFYFVQALQYKLNSNLKCKSHETEVPVFVKYTYR